MNREKILNAIPFIIFGFLVLVVLVGLHHPDDAASNKLALHAGDTAPVTDLPVLGDENARFTVAGWRGKAYIVNFFASWCGDCRAEHEELMTLAASHIPLIGITFKDRADKITAYLDHAGNPYTLIVQDDKGRAALDWGLVGVPETFIIDAQGTVRWHYSGILTDRIVSDELMPAWEASLHGSR